MFQHTAARRRLLSQIAQTNHISKFQHTAARRRLHRTCSEDPMMAFVSTHSRPKAAAQRQNRLRPDKRRFNTQPPEGGCLITK